MYRHMYKKGKNGEEIHKFKKGKRRKNVLNEGKEVWRTKGRNSTLCDRAKKELYASQIIARQCMNIMCAVQNHKTFTDSSAVKQL